jgi:predicted chitinase
MPSTSGDLAATLANAMGNALPLERYRELLPGFLDGLRAAQCTTVERIAQWCAQLSHESGGLRYMEEIDDGSQYNGREDLGNRPGTNDGVVYKGHGPIMITGRANHQAVSDWAYANGHVSEPDYFINHPTELGSDRYGFLGASWYWTVERPGLNALCDASDHEGVCRAINGGLNGYDDRVNRYTNALPLAPSFLPAVLETGDAFMALSDDEQRELLDLLRRVAALLGARR